MKIHFFASLIMIVFFILQLGTVQYDAPTVYTVDGDIGEYAEHYLKFESWMKLSSDQRRKVVTGYLRFLVADDLTHIPAADRQSAKTILWNTSSDELLVYIDETYVQSGHASSTNRSAVDTIVLQYLRNRLETEKNYKDLLMVARQVSIEKNDGVMDSPAHSKYDVPEYSESVNNVFETPQYWFSYDWWERQDQNEKKALVTGFVAFLHILIKEEFCLKEEEKMRYDLFCKSVTVDDLVNHVDNLFKNPLYREEGAQWLIYEYMTYNFQNYIGDPIMLPG